MPAPGQRLQAVVDDVLAIDSPHIDAVQKMGPVHVTAILSYPSPPQPRFTAGAAGFFI